MMKFFSQLANYRNPRSFSYRFRKKRMRVLEDSVSHWFTSETTIRILDLGGTQDFWDNLGVNIANRAEITLVNRNQEKVTKPNFNALVGDVTNLPQFNDNQFDLVFSNSVIEHVGGRESQIMMANEIRRIGKRHFIQTPNLYFPVEPHFLFPLFTFLPEFGKILVARYWSLSHYPVAKNATEAKALINRVRLLRKKEVELLFPDSEVVVETMLGFRKSFIAASKK